MRRSPFSVLRALCANSLAIDVVTRKTAGVVRASDQMVARTFEELEAWRLADALKKDVYRLIGTGPVARDLAFCSQIRESAASISTNLAEGFGRFRPRPFAQFVEIALGSAAETLDALIRIYPQHAEALTTFAIDLTVDALAQGDGSFAPEESEAVSPAKWANFV